MKFALTLFCVLALSSLTIFHVEAGDVTWACCDANNWQNIKTVSLSFCSCFHTAIALGNGVASLSGNSDWKKFAEIGTDFCIYVNNPDCKAHIEENVNSSHIPIKEPTDNQNTFRHLLEYTQNKKFKGKHAVFLQSKNSTGNRTRQRRQFDYHYQPNCFTSAGTYGFCVPFQQCYPYLKIPALIHVQNLLTRMQDACTYLTAFGTQDIGVCCQNFPITDPMGGAGQYPPFYPEQEPSESPESPDYPDSSEETPSNEEPPYEDPYQPADWPPPLPTHPPEHETAPTHPPSTSQHWPPIRPTKPTYPPPKPTTKPPYRPPSTRPPYKPPATQRPPWTKPPYRPTTKPPSQYPTTDSDAEDVNVSECGIKNGNQDQERIVGGHDADPGEWPWMAAIMTNGRLFCGGSLIDNKHVLTAAHCVAHMNPWDVARMRVNLADHNIKSKVDGEHIERRVKKVVRHRGFDPQTLYNDIAILTLDPPVKYTKRVRPICLPAGKAAYSGKMATVIGWGSLKEMGPTPSILQEVNIPIWTNQACRTKYGPAAPGGIVESFLCAGKEDGDSCSGDSGGPLMINDGKWKQVGIVSWGIGCGKGQFPGVYTRMTSYMTWLNKNLLI